LADSTKIFNEAEAMSEINIGIIGEFDPEFAPHRATNEALHHSAAKLGIDVRVVWLPTVTLEQGAESTLESFDGVWCPPGSPYRSLNGALNAIRVAREQGYPFIGTCGGFQHALLEYARNVLGFKDAQHAEYDSSASNLFISSLRCAVAGKRMRVTIRPGSHASALYRRGEVDEDYYCNFGLNPAYQADIESSGLKITGVDQDGEARIVELPTHRFFLATLFLPQALSTMKNPHPLVNGFVAAAQQGSTSRRMRTPTGVQGVQ
jgi:CTP synthase (UTP-ammonia lyase)